MDNVGDYELLRSRLIQGLCIPSHLLTGVTTPPPIPVPTFDVNKFTHEFVGNFVEMMYSQHMLGFAARATASVLEEILPGFRVRPAMPWKDNDFTSLQLLCEVLLVYRDDPMKPCFRVAVHQDATVVLCGVTYNSDSIHFNELGRWELANPQCFERLLEKVDGILYSV